MSLHSDRCCGVNPEIIALVKAGLKRADFIQAGESH